MTSIADKLRDIAKATAERADALEAWSKPIAAVFAPAMRMDAQKLCNIAIVVGEVTDTLADGGPR